MHAAAQIGVSYGRNGQGLPSPPQVVALFNQYNIRRMRIYDTDQETLQALRGSTIELSVGILNMRLEEIAASQANADAWVRDNVQNYPDVQLKNVVVGNEVSPIRPDTSQYVRFVLPAMRNVRTALSAAGRGEIMVTTAIETEVLDPSKNYPPSKGEFRPDVTAYLDPIVRFLLDSGAPIFANIYPYFAYINNKAQIPFNYAFLQPNSGITDPDGVYYDNLYYALVDTLNAALERSAGRVSLAQNGPRKPTPEVIGGETGVPTEQSDAASIENARIYTNNLVRVVKNGTPKRPDTPIQTYIFSMFDENEKPGPPYEQHFGLFDATGQPKYPVDFS